MILDFIHKIMCLIQCMHKNEVASCSFEFQQRRRVSILSVNFSHVCLYLLCLICMGCRLALLGPLWRDHVQQPQSNTNCHADWQFYERKCTIIMACSQKICKLNICSM